MTRSRDVAVETRAGARLSLLHRRLTYLACALVYVSGVLWLLFHYGVPSQNDFGPARHPLESWWLRLHGAAAMGFLIAFGSLLPRHISEAWAMRRNVSTGVVTLAATAFLLLTGWGLYYLGDESLRGWLSVGHWAIGAAGAPLLLIHLLVGRRPKVPVASSRTGTSPGAHAGQPRAGAAARRYRSQ